MEVLREEKDQTQKTPVSPFVEVKDMDFNKSVNILIQAANAAQRAGALQLRDAVLVASAAEYLIALLKPNETKSEK